MHVGILYHIDVVWPQLYCHIREEDKSNDIEACVVNEIYVTVVICHNHILTGKVIL